MNREPNNVTAVVTRGITDIRAAHIKLNHCLWASKHFTCASTPGAQYRIISMSSRHHAAPRMLLPASRV
jgi:hypothetical protein